MSTLRIIEIDDESVSYELDGIEIASTNHDEHGWSGMEAVDKALRKFAKVAHVKVTEEGEMPI